MTIEIPETKEELYGKYYLKDDLILLCKANHLPATGSKEDLLGYICDFIENRPVKRIKPKNKTVNTEFEPLLEMKISENYKNDEIHRAFFIKNIGANFKFNVEFMDWLNENKGKKTYREAIDEYGEILLRKKSGKKTVIKKQFEYNQYTRDFFEDNPKLTKEDCIKCWNYKKQQTGTHKYEKADLTNI